MDRFWTASLPALNAARTAFNLPCVKGTSAMSTFRRFFIGGDSMFVKLGRTSKRRRGLCEPVSTPGGILPRRFISSSIAACIKSYSPSVRCFTALGRSLGRTEGQALVAQRPRVPSDLIMPLTMSDGNQHRAACPTPPIERG
jgi:hypothetical protein